MSMLRRYSQTYETLFGDLPRDSRGGRIYTQEHLQAFKDARQNVLTGEKLEDSFKTLDLAIPTVKKPVTSELAEINQLKDLLVTLTAKIEVLEKEVKELRGLPKPLNTWEMLLNWLRRFR